MKPQDCLVLLKVIAMKQSDWMGKDLAANLGLSQTEVSMSLERSRFAGLLDDSKKRVNTGAFLGFLVHGIKFVFPVKPGGLVRGVHTAWSAPPLHEMMNSIEAVVWPHEDGKARGQAVEPLYACAPEAALRDPKLYELLTLVDALRLGKRREIELATKILKERFEAYAIA
jgi:hypothetical protein